MSNETQSTCWYADEENRIATDGKRYWHAPDSTAIIRNVSMSVREEGDRKLYLIDMDDGSKLYLSEHQIWELLSKTRVLKDGLYCE
jgi:hypothetical protein